MKVNCRISGCSSVSVIGGQAHAWGARLPGPMPGISAVGSAHAWGARLPGPMPGISAVGSAHAWGA